ncbi:hypothetical protein ACOMHN_062423 [Nucella lapillus]
MKRVARIKERNVGHLAQVTGPLWNETRALLDAFYRPFNDRLAAVLQDQSTSQAMKRVARIKERNVGHLAQVTGPLWNETRALLDAFYRPFNDRLAAVLQDRRFAWEDV